MAAKKSSNKQSIRNTPMGKAYLSARSKMDDDGTPYADLDGRPDTGTYLEPVGSGGGSFVTDWFEGFTNGPGYSDGSWLPEEGESMTIPKELINKQIFIPDGYIIKPGPAFTPPGEPKIPTVIVSPEPKKPRKPRPIPDRIDRPRPRYPRPGMLPGETLPPSL